MDKVLCKRCEKPITSKTEVEYSDWLTEFFCDNECAMEHYLEYMGSTVFEFDEYSLEKAKVTFKDGKLYREY